MSKNAVVIEVTRGPVVESRHEGIAAIMKPDGSVVASWGDINHPILPRSANKPIQAMAFVESGAVERFGLGDARLERDIGADVLAMEEIVQPITPALSTAGWASNASSTSCGEMLETSWTMICLLRPQNHR